jgi:cobalt-zinc-cadmium efflux system membrane fusion protein
MNTDRHRFADRRAGIRDLILTSEEGRKAGGLSRSLRANNGRTCLPAFLRGLLASSAVLMITALPALAEEEEHSEHGVVELTPAQVAAAEIEVAAVGRRAVAVTLAATGQVGLNRYREVHLSPRVEGKVVKLMKLVGDPVDAGEPVVLIDSLPLGQAVAVYLEARAELALARAEADRVEELRADGIAPEKRRIAAQAALARIEARLDTAEEQLHLYGMTQAQVAELAPHHQHSHSIFRLTSPIAGEVLALNATLGEQVGPERPTARIANLDEVWVETAVHEKDLGRLRRGTDAWVTVAAYPGEAFPGHLDFITRTVDEETRAARARIVVANPGHRLLPGMFAGVEIAVGEGEPVLAVPRSAIQRDGNATVVFVAEGSGHFQRREVVVGATGPDYAEIRSGLAEGQHVVPRGGFILKSETGKEGMGEGHEH